MVEIPPDHECLADDVLFRNEPPVAAVRTRIAIVPHHEVMPGGNRARETGFIVGAIAVKRKLPDIREPHHRNLGEYQDRMIVRAQGLHEFLRRHEAKAGLKVIVVAVGQGHELLAVDGEPLVAIGNPVAGDADHALDVIERRILRVTEHHHLAVLRQADVHQLQVDDRQPDAVGEFVHQYEVAHQQRRQHRARWNLERLDQERAQQKYDQNHGKKTLRVLDPPRLRGVGCAPASQHEVIEQPDRAGCGEQQEHDQSEIHLLLHLQYRQERFLRNLDVADLFHALLARLLLFQQLFLARDVAAVALGEHVLAHRFDRLARNYMRSYRGLHRDVEHLPRDEFPHLLRQIAAAILRVYAVHDQRQRIDAIAVDQDVEPDQIVGAVFLELIVERGIAAAYRFELVEEIHYHFVERQLVGQHHLAPHVQQVLLRAALLVAQRDHRADVVLRHQDGGRDDRLADLFDFRRVGQPGRIFDLDQRAVLEQ